VQAVRVPVVHVDQEVRLITDPHLKPLAQQLEEEIVVLVQPGPEVAEVDSNLPLHGR
jgi:tetrahydromethanopterin S-methyltransferase subunit B